LLAVSKGQSVERIREAVAAGQKAFGENYVQEALEKMQALPGLEWHLIGPLQSNKARAAAGLFDAVHSVDRPKIAHALERELAARGRVVPALLEVNLGGEESKHGFAPEDLAAAVRPLADLEHLRIAGIMVIPPPAAAPEASRPWFRRARELRDELAARPEWGAFPGWLSMGMSDDFEVAVEEGATHVRVGSLLFGPRG
jgi:hypothetical protein